MPLLNVEPSLPAYIPALFSSFGFEGPCLLWLGSCCFLPWTCRQSPRSQAREVRHSNTVLRLGFEIRFSEEAYLWAHAQGTFRSGLFRSQHLVLLKPQNPVFRPAFGSMSWANLVTRDWPGEHPCPGVGPHTRNYHPFNFRKCWLLETCSHGAKNLSLRGFHQGVDNVDSYLSPGLLENCLFSPCDIPFSLFIQPRFVCLFFHWSILALQYQVSVCCTTTWVSYTYTDTYTYTADMCISYTLISPASPHPTPLGIIEHQDKLPVLCSHSH